MAKKTRTELSTLAVNTNLPDNTSEQITPTTERAQLTEERDSVINYKDDLGGSSNAGKFLTVGADGESLTMVDGATGDVTGTGVAGRVTIWDGTNSITSKAMLVLDDTNKVLKIVIPSANASGGISIDQEGTTGTGSLTFLDDGVYKAQIVYDVLDGNLTLNSNGNIEITPTGDTVISGGAPSVEHVRILSGGNVGIGVTSPGSKLTVVGGTSNFVYDNSPQGTASSVYRDAVFGSTQTANTGITIFGTNQGGISFGDAVSNIKGQVRYQHLSDTLELGAAGNINLSISLEGAVTASNKKNSSTVTDKISTPYCEEKIIEIYSSGSTTLDIATIASGYVSGSLLIECSITGQFSAFATLQGSYRKAQVAFSSSTITVQDIDSYNGQVGNIDYTFVSHGSMKITLSSINHTSFGALNGIAYLRVIGGNTSNSSDVSPSGFTIS